MYFVYFILLMEIIFIVWWICLEKLKILIAQNIKVKGSKIMN